VKFLQMGGMVGRSVTFGPMLYADQAWKCWEAVLAHCTLPRQFAALEN
jgi:hypothetical protein